MLTTIGTNVILNTSKHILMIPETIIETLKRIYNVVMFDDQFKELFAWMQTLHIQTDVHFAEALIADNMCKTFNMQSQRVSFGHLNEALYDLNGELRHLENEIKAHTEKWFHSYRPFGTIQHMTNIGDKKKLLDHCMDRFIMISSFSNHHP